MFGPLPYLHRVLLVAAALLVCAGLGVWVGLMPEVAVGVRMGVVAGLATGLAAAFVLVHDVHRRGAHPARARRRTH